MNKPTSISDLVWNHPVEFELAQLNALFTSDTRVCKTCPCCKGTGLVKVRKSPTIVKVETCENCRDYLKERIVRAALGSNTQAGFVRKDYQGNRPIPGRGWVWRRV